MNNDIKDNDLSDRPVHTRQEDLLDSESRTVSKIFNFLKNSSFTQLTIAVTGVWGIGKTSVINLLQNKIKKNKNNILISFEPLLDGKFEITDILELFYLKLYKNIADDSKLKDIIKKSLLSIVLLSRMKITGSAEISTVPVGMEGKLGAKVEYDWGKNLDDILAEWKKEKPKNFSEQAEEFNKALNDEGYKLYIVIDEIDRLPANYIINILLFCRILESFDNLICIVGIDYEQVINKLIKGDTEVYNYETAKNYLDKLFQIKFNVHHNKYTKIKFALDALKKLDKEKTLANVLSSQEYEIGTKIEEIIDYLSTPRQIKKWLISTHANYLILKHSPNKLDFLSFLAVSVKHPIITDNISKHTLGMLNENWRLLNFVDEKYGTNLFKEYTEKKDEGIYNKIKLTSVGIKIENHEGLKKILEQITSYPIFDNTAAKLLKNYLNSTEYLIVLFCEGVIDESKIALYGNFFGDKIDLVLKELIDSDNHNTYILASDLSETLSEKKIQIIAEPSQKLLIELWDKKAINGDIINPYLQIVHAALKKVALDQVISESPLALSQDYIHAVLDICGIKNRNGVYSISDFHKPLEGDISEQLMKDVKFNNEIIANFQDETIKNVLKLWLENVEKKFINQLAFSEKSLINVFYRYIQWGNALSFDYREKLSKYLIDYLNNEKVTSVMKKKVVELITDECRKFHKDKWTDRNPLEILFDNNANLMGHIFQLRQTVHDIKNIDSFEEIASNPK